MTWLSSLIKFMVEIGAVLITFQALRQLHLERFFRQDQPSWPLFMVLIPVAIGYGCAQFCISFFETLYQMMNTIR